ncbi:GntR family transcriptional regulator [Agrococcus sp. DT81.2]|uniref:GntR family transcriptional regulator n=1 Tax=Agrococcus sp. DT81.2 TaxID=3393414 RepID=UPI003CE5BA4A
MYQQEQHLLAQPGGGSMSTAYQRVADSLRERIRSGELAPGSRLPSEHALMAAHGVSRNTVRQALADLQHSNLVDRQQGRGTFVAVQGVSHVLGDLRSFTETLLDLGVRPGITGIRIDVDEEPPAEAAEFLPGSRIWLVERIRTADGQPFCRMQSWVPDALAAAITPAALQKTQSLYAVMRESLGATPREATEIIRAEAASAEDARLLNVSRGTPLLSMYRWTRDASGRAVEYVRSSSPGDRYQYVIKLQQ